MGRPKPGIRVLVSVADHHKTADVWADLRMRGMLVELWRIAGDKFAGRNEDRVPLKLSDRLDIAATEDRAEADRAVSELCAALKYRLDRYPNRWVVTIRNFAERQGYGGRKLDTVSGSSIPKTSASESESYSESESESDTGKKRSRKRSPSVSCPEELSPEQRTRIRAWAASQTPPIRDGALAPAWERFRDWALSDDHKRRDWEATFRGALGKGWCLGSVGPNGRPVSAAQARQDELHENAREAMRRAGVEDSDAFRLLEGGGT